MKKFDFPLFFDTLFIFSSCWILSLCILRYFRISMWLSIFLSATLSILLSVGIFFLMYRNRKKKLLLAQDRKEVEKLMLHLTLSSPQANRKLFTPVLEKEKRTYLLFSMQPLSADAVAEKIRICPMGKRFTVFCNTLSPEAEKLCQDFGVTTVKNYEVYTKLKENDLLPEKYICAEKKKRGVRERIKISFHKKNSRSFFACGGALLILSMFSFFPLYYVISGSILIITALLVRFFGYT